MAFFRFAGASVFLVLLGISPLANLARAGAAPQDAAAFNAPEPDHASLFKLYMAAHADVLATNDRVVWEHYLLFTVPPGPASTGGGALSKECLDLNRRVQNEITRRSLLEEARGLFRQALQSAASGPKTAVFRLNTIEGLGDFDAATSSFPLRAALGSDVSLLAATDYPIGIATRSPAASGQYKGPVQSWCSAQIPMANEPSVLLTPRFKLRVVSGDVMKRLPMSAAAAEAFVNAFTDVRTSGSRRVRLEALVEVGPMPLTDEPAPGRIIAARAQHPLTGAVLYTFPVDGATTTAAAVASAAASAPADGVPFTPHRGVLLTVRDAPQILTDQAMVSIAQSQIAFEQNTWRAIARYLDPSNRVRRPVNPKRSVFAYEWQTEIDARPDFASGPLMDAFLRPDADWSFVTRDPAWDTRFDAFAEAFLFSRAKIEGRDARFAAQELAPVVGRHLKTAAAKAPTSLWISVRIGMLPYDFQSRSFPIAPLARPAAFRELPEEPHIIPRVDQFRDVYSVPAEAAARATYMLMGTIERQSLDTLPAKPGIASSMSAASSPVAGWREQWSIGASSNSLPLVELIALDRALHLTHVPVDPARAEALAKRRPTSAGASGFSAKVHFEVEKVVLSERRLDRVPVQNAVMLARVQRVDVFDWDGGLLASFPASALPAPKGTPVTTSAAPSSPASPRLPGGRQPAPPSAAPPVAAPPPAPPPAPPVTAPAGPAAAAAAAATAPAAASAAKTGGSALLSELSGVYAAGTIDFTVSLNSSGTLNVVVPGQPTYELEPAGGDGMRFATKGLPGYFTEFRRDATGAVNEAIAIQPNGTALAIRVTGEPLDPKVLASLAGNYSLTPGSPVMTVALDGRDLTLLIPGQPMHRLRYAHGLRFGIVGIVNASVEFKRGTNGLGSELLIRVPQGNTPAYRRAD